MPVGAMLSLSDIFLGSGYSILSVYYDYCDIFL